jgi:hypothetical protein
VKDRFIAGDDEDVVADGEPRRRRGEARVRVEERDHDRHVRAADREDERHPERERERDHRVERRGRGRARHEPREQADRGEEHPDGDVVLAAEGDRAGGEELLQLPEGHEAAGDGEGAEEDLEPERRHLRPAHLGAVAEPQVLGDPDERRRDGAEHVRDGDPLGHRRHRDPDAERVPDHRAEREPGEDPLVAQDLVVEERPHDREEHPERGELHAAPGAVGDGEAPEPEDEQDRRREVGGLDEDRPPGHRRRSAEGGAITSSPPPAGRRAGTSSACGR